MISWNGIYPALITPFAADEDLDLEQFQRLLEVQLSSGIDGVILAGSLGEASTLSPEEKLRLAEAAKECLHGRIPLLLTIAEGSTREALRQVREVQRLDLDGIMLLPPMRYAADEEETGRYLQQVVSATELPVLIYNNPVDYKIPVTLPIFDSLANYPQVQAVKESSRDLSNVSRMRNRFGDRFRILSGVDTLAMESLLMGADGWVAGLVNAFPRETVALYSLICQGRISEALQLYRWFLPLLELDIHPKLVQYIKLAAWRNGLGTDHCRAPRCRLEGAERARILKLIDQAMQGRPDLEAWNPTAAQPLNPPL